MSPTPPRPDDDLAALARALLADLADPAPWILLHGEDALLGHGPVSDVDTALPTVDLRHLRALLHRRPAGLRLVAVWPYDCRGLALFLATPDLRQVVQLDLLADPDGIGRYGVRTPELAAHAHDTAHPWRRPDPVDERLYLLAKRTAKGQDDRVAALRDALGHDRAEAVDRSRTLLSPAARGRVAAALGATPPRGRVRWHVRRAAAQVARGVRRLRHPIGAWLHLLAPIDAAGDVPEHPALVRVRPAPAGPAATLRLVLARWRRGVVVTVGPAPPRWADACLAPGDDPATTVAAWMADAADAVLRRHAASLGGTRVR